MSSGAAIIVVVLIGLGVCCSGAASSIIALVNERAIDAKFFDFLLIDGWGKDSSGTTPTGSKDGKKYCIDTAITACVGEVGDIKKYEECLTGSKTSCIADGGTWTTSHGMYYTPDCTAGARVHCMGKTGEEREKCMDPYKKSCKEARDAQSKTCNPDILGLGLENTEWIQRALTKVDGKEVYKCVSGYTDTNCDKDDGDNATKQCARSKIA